MNCFHHGDFWIEFWGTAVVPVPSSTYCTHGAVKYWEYARQYLGGYGITLRCMWAVGAKQMLYRLHSFYIDCIRLQLLFWKKEYAVGHQTTNGALFDKFSKSTCIYVHFTSWQKSFRKKYGMWRESIWAFVQWLHSKTESCVSCFSIFFFFLSIILKLILFLYRQAFRLLPKNEVSFS